MKHKQRVQEHLETIKNRLDITMNSLNASKISAAETIQQLNYIYKLFETVDNLVSLEDGIFLNEK